MPRRMSCSMTIDAVRERRKTVTRRHVDTWQTLKAGDRLTLIEKGMGLPPGSKQVVLAEVEVMSVRVEPIGSMYPADCAREGFPGMSSDDFVLFWLRSHGYRMAPDGDWPNPLCRRIAWRYLDGVRGDDAMGGEKRIQPPPGHTTCNVYRSNVQTSHLVALDDEGENGGRPTVCGLTRFGRRDPETYAEVEAPDLPGWSMGAGGVFGPGVAQVPCPGCFRASDG